MCYPLDVQIAEKIASPVVDPYPPTGTMLKNGPVFVMYGVWEGQELWYFLGFVPLLPTEQYQSMGKQPLITLSNVT